MDGILNICKPQGLTSFQVVQRVRRILGERKVGHCGTLDPMATGVLVVLFGQAVKRQADLTGHDKRYRGQIRLGVRTDSGDITGKVLEAGPVPLLERDQIVKTFARFLGERTQIPPLFSAVKWKGRRLLDYARKGLEAIRPPRWVTIHSLDLLEHHPPFIDFRLACSKGTYVRSLVEEIGASWGAPATLNALERERSGDFGIESSIPWDALQTMSREDLLRRALPCAE